MYANACEAAGVDPAEPLLADDVLAHSFRIGMAWHRGWRMKQTIEDGEPDLIERTKAKGAEIRRLIGG